jgi:membrane fusion protein, hemolysin D
MYVIYNLEKVLLADKSPRPRAEAFWRLSPEMLAGTDEPNERVRGTEVTTSEPAGQEMVYAARISLDRAQMQVEDKLVTLTPDMAVPAEIKTGSRTVLSYPLSPLKRYRHESLRER